jgi:hypothetical protein
MSGYICFVDCLTLDFGLRAFPFGVRALELVEGQPTYINVSMTSAITGLTTVFLPTHPEVRLVPEFVLFEPATVGVPQLVAVTAMDNGLLEGDRILNLVWKKAALSADARFDGKIPYRTALQVRITDDTPGYSSISPQLAYDTTDGTDTTVTVVFSDKLLATAIIECGFGSENTTATVVSDYTLTCPVSACPLVAGICPYSDLPFPLIVTINGQPTVNNFEFLYTPEPQISGLFPLSGDVRESTVLTFLGADFRASTTGYCFVDNFASPLTFKSNTSMTCRVEPRADLEGMPPRAVSITFSLDGQSMAQQSVQWELRDDRPPNSAASWAIFTAVVLCLLLCAVSCCFWPPLRRRIRYLWSRLRKRKNNGGVQRRVAAVTGGDGDELCGPNALIEMLEAKMDHQDSHTKNPVILANYGIGVPPAES